MSAAMVMLLIARSDIRRVWARISQALGLGCRLAGTLAIFLSVGIADSYAQPVKSVRVTGQGTTHFEARQDAVRQALQIAVSQLVIEQRVVKNDKLILDKISSTMNGFVSNFDTIRVLKTEQGFSIEAQIEVSETRITNFIGSLSGARASINSDNILASVNQERLARQARSEMLLAMLSDFPGDALEAAKPAVRIDQQDPDVLIIESAVRVNPTFVSATKRALATLTETHWKLFQSYTKKPDGLERLLDPFLVATTAASPDEETVARSKVGPYALVCFLKYPIYKANVVDIVLINSSSPSFDRGKVEASECFAIQNIDSDAILRSLQSRGSLDYPDYTYDYDATSRSFRFGVAGQFAVLGLNGDQAKRLQSIPVEDNEKVSILAGVEAGGLNRPNVHVFIHEDWIETRVALRAASVGNMNALEIVPMPRIDQLHRTKKSTMPSLLGKQFVSDAEYLRYYTTERDLAPSAVPDR